MCWLVLVCVPVGSVGGRGEPGASGCAVDRAAEFDHGRVVLVAGCSLAEASVGPVLVVVRDEFIEEASELALVPDQGPVQQFVANGAHPSLSERVGLWSARWNRRSATVSTQKKSVATSTWAWLAMNSLRVGPVRFGVRLRPASHRILHTVKAARQCPSRRSSAWMRRYPQFGFSASRRSTSRRSSPGLAPGRFEAAVVGSSDEL